MGKIKEIYQYFMRKTKETSYETAETRQPKQEKLIDGYAKILQDWMSEEIKPSTEAAEEAILKVSQTDTPQKGWTYTEWTVFIARAIMHRADCVNIYDLYLLHEIMLRCQEDVY